MASVESSIIRTSLVSYGADIIQDRGCWVCCINDIIVFISYSSDEYRCKVLGESSVISQTQKEWNEGLFNAFISGINETTKHFTSKLPDGVSELIRELAKHGTLISGKLSSSNCEIKVKLSFPEKYTFSITTGTVFCGDHRLAGSIYLEDGDREEAKVTISSKESLNKTVSNYVSKLKSLY